MVERAIKRFMDVEIRKGSPSVTRAGFDIPLFFTSNVLLSNTRRVNSFTTADAVGNFYGTDSEEYDIAVAYFSQDPFADNQPAIIKFGKYAQSCSRGLLEMGDSPQTDLAVWQAVTDGTFVINYPEDAENIYNCDFSNVTSLEDVAQVITNAMREQAVYAICYYLNGRFNIISQAGGPDYSLGVLSTEGTGTDISGSGYLDGDTLYSLANPGGSYTSPGAGVCPSLLSFNWVSGLEGNLDKLTEVNDGAFGIILNDVAFDIVEVDLTSATTIEDISFILTNKINDAVSAYGFSVFIEQVGADQIVFYNTTPYTKGTAIGYLTTATGNPGTDISGSVYLFADEGNGTIADGTPTETVAEAVEAIENTDNEWYASSAISAFRDSDDAREMADEIESRRKMFFIETNDTNTLVEGSTSTYGYYIYNAEYDRSNAFYRTIETDHPIASELGLQLPKEMGSTNWAYKQLAGIAEGAAANIDPDVLTEAQKNAAQGINVTLYTETFGTAFTYFGRTGSGEKISTIRNTDFLQARIEEDLLNLFLNTEIIPFSNAGISIADNQLKSSLDLWGVKQGILVEGSVVTSFPSREEVSSTDREAGLLPDGTFTAQLQGVIDTVIIRGTVYL